jgi:hypothetical protein
MNSTDASAWDGWMVCDFSADIGCEGFGERIRGVAQALFDSYSLPPVILILFPGAKSIEVFFSRIELNSRRAGFAGVLEEK